MDPRERQLQEPIICSHDGQKLQVIWGPTTCNSFAKKKKKKKRNEKPDWKVYEAVKTRLEGI